MGILFLNSENKLKCRLTERNEKKCAWSPFIEMISNRLKLVFMWLQQIRSFSSMHYCIPGFDRNLECAGCPLLIFLKMNSLFLISLLRTTSGFFTRYPLIALLADILNILPFCYHFFYSPRRAVIERQCGKSLNKNMSPVWIFLNFTPRYVLRWNYRNWRYSLVERIKKRSYGLDQIGYHLGIVVYYN